MPNLRFYLFVLVVGMSGLPGVCKADTCPSCQGTGTIACRQCIDPDHPGIGGYTSVGGAQLASGCVACGGTPSGHNRDGSYRPGSPGTGRVPCRTCNGSGQVLGQATTQAPPSRVSPQGQSGDFRNNSDYNVPRSEPFINKKNAILKSMKGISDADLGIKDESAGGALGFKGIDDTKPPFSKGGSGSAPVDARATGPSQLDLPGSKDVVYPARNNASFQKGYDALRNRDPVVAAAYFEQAQRELPNDAMVRDALDVTRSMLRIAAQPPGDIPFNLYSEWERTRTVPRNPDRPLINPLHEPELYRAWEEDVWRKLATRMQGDLDGTIRRMYKDEELGAAMKRVWSEYCYEVSDQRHRIQEDFTTAMEYAAKKYSTVTNQTISQLEKENPHFREELDTLTITYRQKRDQEVAAILKQTRDKLDKEMAAYLKRHPEILKARAP